MITLRGSDKSWDYASGTSLALWPKGGKVLLAKAPFTDSTATVLFDGHEPKADNVPVLGLLQVPTPLDYGSRLSAPGKEDSVRPGRLIVYGDSNCVDSAHMTQPCWWLFEQLISYAVTGVVNVELDVGLDLLHAQLKSSYVKLPARSKALKFERFSKVGQHRKEGANATCTKFWPFSDVPLQHFTERKSSSP
jgi:membrane-bound transcription factor site-1 protease